MAKPHLSEAEIRKQLEDSVGLVAWSEIKPHQERDAVIVVSQTLDLLDVGVILALDQSEKVGKWITQGLLSKPTLGQLESWNAASQVKFLTVVVQPWVLLQSQAN
jgi:hypothetical protein